MNVPLEIGKCTPGWETVLCGILVAPSVDETHRKITKVVYNQILNRGKQRVSPNG